MGVLDATQSLVEDTCIFPLHMKNICSLIFVVEPSKISNVNVY
jgi:hypothetical protein